MVFRSIIIFIVLFTSYSLLHYFVPGLNKTLSQWQENQSRAENYVYQKDEYKFVIVGSSLSQRLEVDTIDGFYNLATSGRSIYEGLEVIKRSGFAPQVLFIEANYPIKNLDKEFIENTFSFEIYTLKKLFPILRSSYSVTALPLAIKDKLKGKAKVEKQTTSDEILKNMLKEQITKYNVNPEPNHLKKRIKDLKRYIEYFIQKKCKIVFFEMPVHTSLQNLPSATLSRAVLRKNFSKNCRFFDTYNDSLKQIKTTDGIHLGTNDISIFFPFFYQNIKAFTK